MLKGSGFILYMEAMSGYNENRSLQFVNSWKDRRVMINGISFQINEEIISLAIGLSMKGKK